MEFTADLSKRQPKELNYFGESIDAKATCIYMLYFDSNKMSIRQQKASKYLGEFFDATQNAVRSFKEVTDFVIKNNLTDCSEVIYTTELLGIHIRRYR